VDVCAVEQGALLRRTRGRARRVRVGRCRLAGAQPFDLLEGVGRRGITREPRDHGGDRGTQLCQIRSRGNGELQPSRAERRRRCLLAGLCGSEHDRRRRLDRLAQRIPLRVVEPVERLGVHEDDDPSGPEIDVRRQVLRSIVVRVGVDRRDLLLERVHLPNQMPPAREGDRNGAEGTERLAPDLRAVQPDPHPGEVGDPGQRSRDAEQLAQRAGQHAEADEPERLDVLQHRVGDPGVEQGALEVVALHDERRVQRIEALYPHVVKGAASDPAEV
jgi:hypothetical protein